MATVVTDDGVALATYDLGGSGPDVLLAHATGFHAHVWLPVVERLRPHAHCVAFDERGHGRTEPPGNGNWSWTRFGLDALAVIEGMGLVEPVGVGHSAGGALLLLAEQARPGTFRSIYCFEPIVFPPERVLPPGQHPLAAGARRRREEFPSRQAAYDNYASKPPLAALRPDALRAYVDHGFDDLQDGSVRLRCRGEDEARTYEGSMEHDAWAHLGEIACPVHLACGADSDAVGPSLIEAQAAVLTAGSTEVFPEMGHFGPMQDPDRVAASILRTIGVRGG